MGATNAVCHGMNEDWVQDRFAIITSRAPRSGNGVAVQTSADGSRPQQFSLGEESTLSCFETWARATWCSK
eukprot:6660393-Prymnesium_polylepis.1